MDECMDGCMDGWMDGWMDGQGKACSASPTYWKTKSMWKDPPMQLMVPCFCCWVSVHHRPVAGSAFSERYWRCHRTNWGYRASPPVDALVCMNQLRRDAMFWAHWYPSLQPEVILSGAAWASTLSKALIVGAHSVGG